MPHSPRTPQPPAPSQAAAKANQAAGVPLAVWPLDPDDNPRLDGRPYAAQGWLQRLVAEYALPDQPVQLMDAGSQGDTPASPTAPPSATGPTSRPTSATVRDGALGLLMLRDLDGTLYPTRIVEFVDEARTLLQPGARLILITRPRQDGSATFDPVSAFVRAGTAAGFGYLQHVVLTNLNDEQLGPDRNPRAGSTGVPRHAASHLDMTVLQLAGASTDLPQVDR